MSEDTVQKSSEVLVQSDVVKICQGLKKQQLRLLSLRECHMEDSDLQRVLKLVGSSGTLQQLTLNVGMLTVPRHVELLSASVMKNQSLTGLHVHGSCLGDDGMKLLGKGLLSHPNIVCLDVGDCQLGDSAIDVLYDLLLPEINRPALTELTLSANPRISAQGWAQLSMAIANCTTLRVLMVDYNPLGDYAASCLLVAVAATQNMEVLDLESCGLTEHTAQLILHLVQNHLGGLSKIVLGGNKVKKSTVDAIKTYLRENHMDTESEGTTTDLDLTSITSKITSDSGTASNTDKSSSSSSSSSSDSSSSDSDDDTSTMKGSEAGDSTKSGMTDKEKRDGEEKENDEDAESLGDELTEVPVYYA